MGDLTVRGCAGRSFARRVSGRRCFSRRPPAVVCRVGCSMAQEPWDTCEEQLAPAIAEAAAKPPRPSFATAFSEYLQVQGTVQPLTRQRPREQGPGLPGLPPGRSESSSSSSRPSPVPSFVRKEGFVKLPHEDTGAEQTETDAVEVASPMGGDTLRRLSIALRTFEMSAASFGSLSADASGEQSSGSGMRTAGVQAHGRTPPRSLREPSAARSPSPAWMPPTSPSPKLLSSIGSRQATTGSREEGEVNTDSDDEAQVPACTSEELERWIQGSLRRMKEQMARMHTASVDSGSGFVEGEASRHAL
ncbi:unnamed protein product [Polarella glacialis]|uniref:Uncharacterized protein n=1 Tax=Polarella glacialis TaxID=89957 RepID=A0A813HZA2_POLGL|nr:unnamed protein product [Polarella glacialis]